MRQPLFMKMGFDMKKHFFIFILTVLMLASACAFAAPELSNVMADDVALISGQNDWYFDFETTEGGTLAMTPESLSAKWARRRLKRERGASAGTACWQTAARFRRATTS